MVLVVVVALVVGGEAWALWPATTWPRTFCAPVVRVVGADARAIVTSRAANENLAFTPAEHKMIAALQADIVLAEAAAPTAQLRLELRNYMKQLHGIYTSPFGKLRWSVGKVNSLRQHRRALAKVRSDVPRYRERHSRHLHLIECLG